MSVVYRYPLTSTFAAGTDADGAFDSVRSMQAGPSNPATNPSGDESPTGNGEQIKIVNGWARMTIWETDFPFQGNIRAEITGLDETVPSTRLYRWTSRFEGWPASTTRFVVMQMHCNHGGSAYAEDILMLFDGTTLELAIPVLTPPAQGVTSRTVAAIPLQMGVEYKHALLVKWAKDGNGSIQWIVNGQVIFNATKIGTEYDYVTGPYLKLGVYNSSGATGWGTRQQFVRNVIVTDGLDGKSWPELHGSIPRPRPFVVR